MKLQFIIGRISFRYLVCYYYYYEKVTFKSSTHNLNQNGFGERSFFLYFLYERLRSGKVGWTLSLVVLGIVVHMFKMQQSICIILVYLLCFSVTLSFLPSLQIFCLFFCFPPSFRIFCLFLCVPIFMSFCMSFYISVSLCLSVCLCLSLCLSVFLSFCLSVFLSLLEIFVNSSNESVDELVNVLFTFIDGGSRRLRTCHVSSQKF